MAQALGAGFLRAQVVRPSDLVASDILETARSAFADATKAKATPHNREVVEHSDILILATKPQGMGAVLAELSPMLNGSQIVVSIAAGITIESIESALGSDRPIIRVMPNTPALVGAMAAGYSLGGTAADHEARIIERLLGSVGVAVRVPESLLDAVTGLSGSGPAYLFLIIEALSDGGVRAGLPRDIAQKLAAQTVLGSAKMVIDCGLHPAELKDQVASPGGTTIAGLSALESHGVRGALIDAVVAATQRAKELRQGV